MLVTSLQIPSGSLTQLWKMTIHSGFSHKMVIFNSYVKLPEGRILQNPMGKQLYTPHIYAAPPGRSSRGTSGTGTSGSRLTGLPFTVDAPKTTAWQRSFPGHGCRYHIYIIYSHMYIYITNYNYKIIYIYNNVYIIVYIYIIYNRTYPFISIVLLCIIYDMCSATVYILHQNSNELHMARVKPHGLGGIKTRKSINP